jgi:hypothetical protein
VLIEKKSCQSKSATRKIIIFQTAFLRHTGKEKNPKAYQQ